jgi:cystathionine beta-lyase/cystathionine gamma-synthase
MRFGTMAIHAGDRPDATTGAISVPIYQTSTFVFEDVGRIRGWDYSRTANPTRKVFEDTIAQPEGGKSELTGGIKGANTFLRRLKIFSLAESLGGTASLVEHPATMSHASMPKDYRDRVGITNGLIRLSVGLENIDDLTEDLEQALNRL